MLMPLYGAGKVVARVAVELDMDSVTIVDQDYDPKESGTLVKRQMLDQDSLLSKDRALGDKGVGANPEMPAGGGLTAPLMTCPSLKQKKIVRAKLSNILLIALPLRLCANLEALSIYLPLS